MSLRSLLELLLALTVASWAAPGVGLRTGPTHTPSAEIRVRVINDNTLDIPVARTLGPPRLTLLPYSS